MFVLIGFSLFRALVPGPLRLCRHDLFGLTFGAAIGIGIVSCLFFYSLPTGIPVSVLEHIFLFTATFVAIRRSRPACPFCEPVNSHPQRMTFLLSILLVAVTITAVGVFIRTSVQAPHGAWDAWGIHNMHARFLYRGESHWRDLFSPLLNASHPDYPLLLPAFIAREWKTFHTDTTVIPTLVALLFTFATIIILTISVSFIRDSLHGILSGLVLLGTPYFVIAQGASQTADVPLAFFFLATLALLALRDHRPDLPGLGVLAGITGALGTWTKNEGLLLFVAVSAAYLSLIALRRRWQYLDTVVPFLLGAAPILAIVLYFKISLAPENYVLTQQSLTNLLGIWRYVKVGKAFASHLWTFGGVIFTPIVFLAGYMIVMRLRPLRTLDLSILATWLAIVIAATGYFLMYVSTAAWLLDWLLESSIDRLLLHLWPATIFGAFLVTRQYRRFSWYG